MQCRGSEFSASVLIAELVNHRAFYLHVFAHRPRSIRRAGGERPRAPAALLLSSRLLSRDKVHAWATCGSGRAAWKATLQSFLVDTRQCRSLFLEHGWPSLFTGHCRLKTIGSYRQATIHSCQDGDPYNALPRQAENLVSPLEGWFSPRCVFH